MKRILFFVLIVAAMISCKDWPDKKLSLKEKLEQTDCSETIVLNRNLLSPDWIEKNIDIICSYNLDKVFVNLEKISVKSNKVAEWLKKNDTFINFPDSYSYIENIHTISNVENIPSIGELKPEDYIKLSLQNLKDSISSKGGTYGNHYDSYMSFKMINKKLTMSLKDFDEHDRCYSIPMIKSILSKNRIDENSNPIFEFSSIKVNNDYVVFFRIQGVTNLYTYYDFSHKPPLHDYDKGL